MKIVFFGLGSIGQRHASILFGGNKHDLYAFRSEKSREMGLGGVKELYSWDEVKSLKPDIVFITNPTFLHVKTAIKCAELGCKLFIEKPVGKDLIGLERLLKIVRRKRLVTYIAYNLRFHPVIKVLHENIKIDPPLHMRVVCSSYLPDWRPGTDYLESYSASKKMGGGVVLDLSHELDYVSYLTGKIEKISGDYFKLSNVTKDAEDSVDVIARTSLCPVNIHLNFLSQIKERTIKIDFKDRSVIGDLVNGEVLEYKEGAIVKKKKFDNPINQSYIDQIKYFFNNIDNPQMMNNLLEAVYLYKKMIAFKKNKHG